MNGNLLKNKIIWMYLAIFVFVLGTCVYQGYTYLRDAVFFPQGKVDAGIKTSTFHQQGISFIYPSEWWAVYDPEGVKRNNDEIFTFIHPFPQTTPRIEVAKTTSPVQTLDEVAIWGASKITGTNVEKQPLTKMVINGITALRLDYVYPINDTLQKREMSGSQIYLY